MPFCASIYAGAFPDQIQHLLKYMSIIRMAAKRRLGTGWKNYDVQFRLRLSRTPDSMSFAIVDQELWLLCMGPSVVSFDTNDDRKCFDFNFRLCSRNVCPHKHSCLNCSGPHPLQPTQLQSKTRIFQSQSTVPSCI